MNSNQLYLEIINYCKSNYNQANVEKYSRYFKGNYDAWGLSQPQVNDKVKELSKNKEINLDVIFDASELLFNSGKYEEISFVLLLINTRDKHYSIETLEKIEKLFEIGIYNWAHADTLGMMVLPKFVKKNIVDFTYFNKWIYSPFKFQRRSAAVTIIKNIKSIDNIEKLFAIIEPLMIDTEREVHQGVGWFLKKAWEKYPVETENFLMKYKDISPRLIFQIACEKMDKDHKLNFRKENNKKSGLSI